MPQYFFSDAHSGFSYFLETIMNLLTCGAQRGRKLSGHRGLVSRIVSSKTYERRDI